MTKKRVKIIPGVKGEKVFNPETGRDLIADGEMVFVDRYWERRIRKGEAKISKTLKAEQPLKVEEPAVTTSNKDKKGAS